MKENNKKQELPVPRNPISREKLQLIKSGNIIECRDLDMTRPLYFVVELVYKNDIQCKMHTFDMGCGIELVCDEELCDMMMSIDDYPTRIITRLLTPRQEKWILDNGMLSD